MSTIREAVAILKEGGLVAFPTETVYGLGADASNPEAVARIFAAKGRPPGRSLSILLGRQRDPAALARWTPEAQRLADAFWPGPLTLVLARTERVPDIVTGGRDTVGLRVPDHPVALDLLDAFGGGLAAPSANRSGDLSPTTAQHVIDDLGSHVDLVLDGGPCEVGVESTVLGLVGEPAILRPGALTVDRLEAVLGRPIRGGGVVHARTHTPLRACDDATLAHTLVLQPAAALLWWGAPAPDHPGDRTIVLPDEPAGYARAMFDALRRLDALHAPVLLVRQVPDDDAWDTVRSRLSALERDG